MPTILLDFSGTAYVEDDAFLVEIFLALSTFLTSFSSSLFFCGFKFNLFSSWFFSRFSFISESTLFHQSCHFLLGQPFLFKNVRDTKLLISLHFLKKHMNSARLMNRSQLLEAVMSFQLFLIYYNYSNGLS